MIGILTAGHLRTGLTKAWLGRFGELASSEHVHDEYASINHTHTPASIGAAVVDHTHDIATLGGLKGATLANITLTSNLVKNVAQTFKMRDSNENYDFIILITTGSTVHAEYTSRLRLRFDGVTNIITAGGELYGLSITVGGYNSTRNCNMAIYAVTSIGIVGFGTLRNPDYSTPEGSYSIISGNDGPLGDTIVLHTNNYDIQSGYNLKVIGIKA